MKLSLEQAKRRGDGCLAAGQAIPAIQSYLAVLELAPYDVRSRLALADALKAAGDREAACLVYTATAQLAIDAGLPLFGIVACRALEEMDFGTDSLLDRLAANYCRESSRVGDVGAQLAISYDPKVEIAEKDLTRSVDAAKLVAQAKNVGCSVDGVGALPKTFRRIPVLGALDQGRLRAVLPKLIVKRLPSHHVLIKRGEKGTCCYLVADGEFRVTAPDDTGVERDLATVGSNALIGEMALISGSPRLATVTSSAPSDVLELGPDALGVIGDQLHYLAPALEKVAENRWMKNLLEQSAVFRVFDGTQRTQLLEHCLSHEVPAGTQLFGKDEMPKGIYILLKGDVMVTGIEPETGQAFEMPLSAGTAVGINALLNESPATYSVNTITPATVFFLGQDSFNRLLDAIPEFASSIEQLALHRARVVQASMDSIRVLSE